MADHNIMTESEEMYLVTIARFKEQGKDSPMPLSRLAEELDILPVSANQMVRKLEETGLVCYTPYKGVELTQEGARKALQILRRRRLWEVFLIEQLKIGTSEAGELACRMEHFFPVEAAEKLAAYLGNPSLSPQGLPIPSAQTTLPASDLPVATLGLDESGLVTRLEADPAGRAFLQSEGVHVGDSVKVIAISGSGSILIETGIGRSVHLSSRIAQTIWVKK